MCRLIIGTVVKEKEAFDDTKGVSRVRIEEEQTTQWLKEKDQGTNNNLQNITQN